MRAIDDLRRSITTINFGCSSQSAGLPLKFPLERLDNFSISEPSFFNAQRFDTAGAVSDVTTPDTALKTGGNSHALLF